MGNSIATLSVSTAISWLPLHRFLHPSLACDQPPSPLSLARSSMECNLLEPITSINDSGGSTRHEVALAPSLAPFGNASEADGANRLEPSRASNPAPTNARIIHPDNSSNMIEDDITAQQCKIDRSRGVAFQPQPTVITKASEATSFASQQEETQLPYTRDHSDVELSNGNGQNIFSNNIARPHSVRGSISEYSGSGRRYARTEYGHHDGLNKDVSSVEGKQSTKIAPEYLQPTNEGSGAVGRGFKLPNDFEDDEDKLNEASVAKDEEDPDAIYRYTTQTAAPFEADTSSVRLTKEELKAEKRDMKARKRQKLVRDPVTQKDIWIENARGSTKKFMSNDGVIAPKYRTLQDLPEKDAAKLVSYLHKIPLKDDKTNLLFYPMAPPEWKELMEESQQALFQWAYIMILILISVQVIFSAFPARYALWINTLCAVGSVLFVKQRVQKSFIESFQNAERVRGENATLNALPESVEWLNNIVRTIWPTINPELFAAPIDLLEDAMQKQVPNIVHTVKVSDLDIGAVPLRILSMRYLPDDGAPRGAEDASGEYVNLEVAFGYRAGKTDKTVTSKAKNIHLLIWFLVGLRNVLGIPIPVWVEVHGIMGKARVRVQLLPDPPFLKNATITLLGMPKIELSTVPISNYFINVMNLPFVSQLVAFAVKTVCKDFIAPRSYTMDVSRLMIGDDVKKETTSTGVLMICLHGAVNVPRADHQPGRSKVDPYATVQYSRFGKTMYSTRVISQDFNPVWEETCFLPILPAAIKAGEKIRVNLWDSDRLTADDLLGRVEVDLLNLVQNPGMFERRVDKVTGCDKTRLHWSIGFFGKVKIPDQDVPEFVDTRVPPGLRDNPDFLPEQPLWSVDSKTEQLICRIPPLKNCPGILSIQIHQINDLGVLSAKTRTHSKNGLVMDAEAVEQGKEDDSGAAPSSYCTVALNDELVYKTRTRAYTSRPIFNASFERFVRSFSDTRIRVCVRDQRFREDDPIVGILPLALSEELSQQGQVTRWYPLSEGIGYGQIRVSLLFRNIDCSIPRTLQGWNVGTLYIFGIRAITQAAADAEALQDCSLRIDTMLGHKTIGAVHASKADEGVVAWDLGSMLIMPIRRRHATSLNLEAHRGGVPFTKKGLFSGIYGACIIALSALDDDKREKVKIPIFQTKDYIRFKQNSLAQDEAHQDQTLKKLGYMEVDCILTSGLSDAHRRFIKRSKDLAQTHETWETERSYKKKLELNAQQERKEAIVKARKLHDIQERSDNSDQTLTDQSLSRNDEKERSVKFVSQGGLDTTSTLDIIDDDHDPDWDDDQASLASRTSRRSIKEWVIDKAEERRERHRRHRGIMQQKPARTASWLKNGLRRGISKASRALTINREDDLIEREV